MEFQRRDNILLVNTAVVVADKAKAIVGAALGHIDRNEHSACAAVCKSTVQVRRAD